MTFNLLDETRKLENKREKLHSYVIMKLEEMDYHGVADAAMDLREIDARLKALLERFEG